MPRTKNASYRSSPRPHPIEGETMGHIRLVYEDETSSENDSASLHSKDTEEDTEEDNAEDNEPLQPLRFYFSPDKFSQTCKIQSRCKAWSTVKLLDGLLSVTEKRWFINHPQFKHIWHLYKEPNHKVMGMWMLLLRTACTEKKRVAWFVVNGIPIRYSMKEHAIISELDCHDFPPRYESLGSLSFVKRWFGEKKNITLKQVKDTLQSMDGECDGDRLNMAVLFFLCTIIKGKKKEYGGGIDSFILQIVNDLDVCQTFPWGRYTFEDCMESLSSMIQSFDGNVKPSWGFPGFILPLELLAFECIPDLCKAFRVDVREAYKSCPRMCRMRFKKGGMKGFPLEDINEKLGTTKDIRSCLEPDSDEEQALFLRLMERVLDDERDHCDPIADAWNKRVDFDQKTICWEKLFNIDVAARRILVEEEQPEHQHQQQEHQQQQQELQPQQDHQQQQQEHPTRASTSATRESSSNMRMMRDFEDVILKAMEKQFKEVKDTIASMDTRLKYVEKSVFGAREHVDGMDFHYESGWEDCGGDGNATFQQNKAQEKGDETREGEAREEAQKIGDETREEEAREENREEEITQVREKNVEENRVEEEEIRMEEEGTREEEQETREEEDETREEEAHENRVEEEETRVEEEETIEEEEETREKEKGTGEEGKKGIKRYQRRKRNPSRHVKSPYTQPKRKSTRVVKKSRKD